MKPYVKRTTPSGEVIYRGPLVSCGCTLMAIGFFVVVGIIGMLMIDLLIAIFPH